MNKILLSLSVVAMLAACGPSNQNLVFELANDSDVNQNDAQFVLTREQLRPVTDATLPVVKNEAGEAIPSQVDDLDRDGKWDELAFVYSLDAQQHAQVKVYWVAANAYPTFPARTNVHLGKKVGDKPVMDMSEDLLDGSALPWRPYPYQTDGPSWENDKAGFRHYFDGRHSRDYFGKRTTEMVMDSVGIRPDGTIGDTYHVLADWGRDILSCANSFGLGGLALYQKDTLIRFGVLQYVPQDVMDSTRFTLINKGPVRGVFTLEHFGWKVDSTDNKINLKQTIVIWPGRYGYENRVEATGIPDSAQLVTGIVANNNDAPYYKTQYDNKIEALITHDKQSYNKEFWLGMSVMVPTEYFGGEYDAPLTGSGIVDTWCAKLNMPVQGGVKYYVFGAWELDNEKFADRQYFIDKMAEEGQFLAHRATITEIQ